jgi:hypothetical protein
VGQAQEFGLLCLVLGRDPCAGRQPDYLGHRLKTTEFFAHLPAQAGS